MKRRIALYLCVLVLLSFLISCAAGRNETVLTYEPSEEFLVNPLIGNAVWASETGERPVPFSLVYANVTWRELEPEEGRFAFEEIEEKNHFARWRSEGKRLILRLVADLPSRSPHCDLPDWLADSVRGAAYDIEYGMGWCPDYTDERFLSAHRAAVAALGERYDGDPFVAFVELGSLGHWGEWHVHPDAGEMPGEEVKDRIAKDYRDAFPATLLLMRRPFRAAAKYGFGLYNDMAGHTEDTLEWLDWIENGDGPSDEQGLLTPMPDAWKSVPVGGELTSALTMDELLGDRTNRRNLIRTLRLSHASWIGPHSLADLRNKSLVGPAMEVLSVVGYRLRVSECRIASDRVTVVMENDGIAPFPYPWPVQLRISAEDGSETVLDTDLDLRGVLPGEPVSASVPLPSSLRDSWVRIEIGILDPLTGAPGVRLAMKTEEQAGRYLLAER